MAAKIRHKALKSDKITPLEEKNLQTAYEAALEGIVLLENDGCLPVKPGKIALFGAGADMTLKGGTGSGEVNGRHAVSIMEGLEMAGFTVTTKPWIEDYRYLFEEGEKEYEKQFKKNLFPFRLHDIINLMSNPYQPPFGQRIAKQDLECSDTDTCIYVVTRQAGEGADRKLEKNDYSLTEVEWNNIALCASYYEKMIVVINTGAAFDMNFLEEISGINAVWFYCQQGAMGGLAFAHLLCGKETPSGKLASTWPMHYEDIPFAMEFGALNGNLEEEYYYEGIFVGYRYYDSFHVEPRYPFGYGLSYTSFGMSAKCHLEGTKACFSVEVTNQGEEYAGKEIVQLYVCCPQGRIVKEYQKLAGFAKTDLLKPGEKQTVSISFDLEDMASYDEEKGCMVLEKGEYLVFLGSCSRRKGENDFLFPAAKILLETEVVTEKLQRLCKREKDFDEISPNPIRVPMEDWEEKSLDLEILDKNMFRTKEHDYREREISFSKKEERILDSLTIEEMADLVVGDGMFGGSYFNACGSAGTTTGKLVKKGIPNICLADGPAGLRLQRRSALLKNGRLKAVDPFMNVVKYLPKGIKNLLLADADKHQVVYQHATAFPVGTALAQSWNKSLLEKVGAAVGEEMEAYGVTYWLAPALNIQRNPLCGRNFEYFSEDPYISGMASAAITKGVQSHRGCYVTIKHFCCNNQEDNRNRTNAIVSERALREIYLRGFEVAIKESNPGAVMSSYNKVNDVYVNNNPDFMINVLKREWGFEGVVMTDWFATGLGLGSHREAVKSGHDMIMPGSAVAKRNLVNAVKRGKLKKTELRRSAGKVLHAVMSSRIYQGFLRERKASNGKKY